MEERFVALSSEVPFLSMKRGLHIRQRLTVVLARQRRVVNSERVIEVPMLNFVLDGNLPTCFSKLSETPLSLCLTTMHVTL
jgi:hypothetical protein